MRANYHKSTVHPRGTIRNISTITGTSRPCVGCHHPPSKSMTPSTWLKRPTATYLPLVCVTMWTCTGQRRFGLNVHQKRQPPRGTGWLKPPTRPCGDSVFITPTGLAFLPPATAAHLKRQKAQASKPASSWRHVFTITTRHVSVHSPHVKTFCKNRIGGRIEVISTVTMGESSDLILLCRFQ